MSGHKKRDWKRIMGTLRREVGDRDPLAVNRQLKDPFRVLVSTIISLRTKDEVTDESSRRLFSQADTPESMARMDEAQIAKLIYPAGFYRNKSRSIKAISGILIESHASKVPSDMEDLLALPGVGRKTANLVRNVGFGLPGICVDTHVHRISNRMGWVSTRNPEETERALETVLPERYWIPINHLLVRFGKRICTPVSPRCSECPFADFCPRINVTRSR
jgi:endonuclease-3